MPDGHFEAHQDHPIGAMAMAALHIGWKWRWVVAASVILCVIGGIVATLLTTPMYRATALMRIDREAAKIVTLSSGETTTGDRGAEFYQTQYGVLRSRNTALQAVDALRLDTNAAFMTGGEGRLAPPTTAAEREARRQGAANMVAGGLQVQPVSLSGLVNVSFDSYDPALAAQIANAVGQAFIDANFNLKLDQSEDARSKVAGLLEDARQRLNESQLATLAYARQARLINITGGEGVNATSQSIVVSDLNALNSALAESRTARILAEERWRQAQAVPVAEIPEVQQSAVVQSLRQSLVSTQAQYQNVLGEFREQAPEAVRLKAQLDEYNRQVTREMQAVKDSLNTSFQTARAQEAALNSAVNALKSDYMADQEKNIQFSILQRDVDTNKSQYESLLQRYKDLDIASNVGANNVSFVDRAPVPGAPFKPQPLRNMMLAVLIGLALGGLLALGLEQLDETIKNPADVEGKLGITLLGAIPTAPKNTSPLQALADPRSALSEAYYSVRTALQFSTREGAPRTLLVTSARPSEGKSTSALALAQGFARLGLRTLLIDSDLRNPSLHKLLTRSNSAGLSNLLTGAAQLSAVVQPSQYENLGFISCGPLPPNPAELLGGSQMARVLSEALESFDQVIVDGPPVMGLADAPLLAGMMAGTVLVVEANATKRGLARSALTRLRVGPVNLLGAILSKFDSKRVGYGYGYGYTYNYGAGGEAPATPSKNDGVLGGILKRKSK